MSRLSDDILNKYIDGELNESERLNISNQLEFSEEDRKRYHALLAVHNGLKKIKPLEVSADFTSMLMSRALKSNKSKKDQKIFIFSISSIFIVISLVIIGFLLSWFFSSYSTDIAQGSSYLSETLNHLTEFAQRIKLSGKNISIVGSVISLTIIVTAYFFFDNLKQTKDRLSKLN